MGWEVRLMTKFERPYVMRRIKGGLVVRRKGRKVSLLEWRGASGGGESRQGNVEMLDDVDKLRALARDCETTPRHPSNRVLVYTPASAQHSSYPFHEESLDISISGSIPYPWHQKVDPSPTTSFLFHLSPHDNPTTRIPYPSPTPFLPSSDHRYSSSSMHHLFILLFDPPQVTLYNSSPGTV